MANPNIKKGDVIGVLDGQKIISTGDFAHDKQVLQKIKPGINIDALERDVIKKFGVAGDSDGYDDVANIGQNKPQPRELDPNVQHVANTAMGFPIGSIEQNRGLEAADKIQNLLGQKALDKLTSGITAEDVSSVMQKQQMLKEAMLQKSRGFGGKGIDTGPMVGGQIGDALPFVEGGPNFVPSGISEFYNDVVGGEGENSADRGEFRRKTLELSNPVRKDVTGAAAPYAELINQIFPSMPNEKDNDLTYYKKGIGSLKDSQTKLLMMLDALKRSGSADVSGFSDLIEKNPDDVVNEFLNEITKNYSLDKKGNITNAGKYDFGKIMPDTTKAFLNDKEFKKLFSGIKQGAESKYQNNGGQRKADYRWNEAKGVMEKL